MENRYLYFIIDLLTLLFPFVFSFYPKANFSRKWKHLWPAIVIPALIFILWDEAFTQMGVWGFNSSYVSGVYILNLPLEELLFFICIPYACVFTYEALNYLIENNHFKDFQKHISIVISIGSIVLGLLNTDKWYTCVTFLALGVFILYLQFIRKRNYLGRFYFAFLFLLVPFFIVNGILTGSLTDNPVVWYNDSENLGIRLGTIPVEDIFYGMLLILMNVSIFQLLQSKASSSR